VSCGLACSTTSTSCRHRVSPQPQRTKAVRAGPASASTSRRSRPNGPAGVPWRTGCLYLARGHNVGAFALGMGGEQVNPYQMVIGIGAWLGTIMLFNVWVLIWPNQKKILGIVQATDDEKAKARKTAGLASRTNFVLSIPMLMCMAAAGHGANAGLPF